MAEETKDKELTMNSEEVKELKHYLSEMDAKVHNATTARSEFYKKFLDPRRSINDECGFPETPAITVQSDYRELYYREGVATRVVEVMPDECWAFSPDICEDEDPEVETQFEAAFKEMVNQLKGQSWYKDENNSLFWEALRRADILSGLGSFGVVLLGIDDEGDSLEVELTPGQNRSLKYLRVFDQSLIEISAVDQDVNSDRYGLPILYTLTLNDPTNDEITAGLPTSTVKVHWTRVIHIADNKQSSELFGAPRLRPVLNNILSLRKLYAGSAEMYWRGAFPGLSFETHPSLGGDVTVDTSALKTMVEQYQNSLQRYVSTTGMAVKSLAPQVVDPSNQVAIHIEAICIAIQVPKRVFMGSERGELASSQDARKWNKVVAGRQNNQVTPNIICPVIDRLIWAGVLPEPQNGYSVKFKDLDTLSAIESAELALKRTEAMAKYSQADLAGILMDQKSFLTEIMGIDEELADSILEDTVEAMRERELELEDEEDNPEATQFGDEDDAQEQEES